MKTPLLYFVLILLTVLSACDKEDDQPASEINISNITLEETYNLGETHQINLTIIKPTPCHIIEEEDVTVEGKTYSYNFRLIDEAEVCIQVLARDEKASVIFEPVETGEHTLQFFINDALYETRTVLVTE